MDGNTARTADGRTSPPGAAELPEPSTRWGDANGQFHGQRITGRFQALNPYVQRRLSRLDSPPLDREVCGAAQEVIHGFPCPQLVAQRARVRLVRQLDIRHLGQETVRALNESRAGCRTAGRAVGIPDNPEGLDGFRRDQPLFQGRPAEVEAHAARFRSAVGNRDNQAVERPPRRCRKRLNRAADENGRSGGLMNRRRAAEAKPRRRRWRPDGFLGNGGRPRKGQAQRRSGAPQRFLGERPKHGAARRPTSPDALSL